MSIARTTPAQNPRGWARTTRIEFPVSRAGHARTGGYSQHLGAVQPAQDYNSAASFLPASTVRQGLERPKYGTVPLSKLPLPSLGNWNRQVARGFHDEV